MQEFGGWIKNADTKSTILAAAVGLVFVALLSRVDRIVDVARSDSDWRCVVVILSASVVASMLALAVCLYLALRARKNPGPFSRFSWPAIESLGDAKLQLHTANIVDEAWIQIRALAKIANRKYLWFNRALTTFWTTLVLFGLLVAALEVPRH